jgi:hypothetical protein
MTTPVLSDLTSTRSSEDLSNPSANSRLPPPRTIGWTQTLYSSTRSWAASVPRAGSVSFRGYAQRGTPPNFADVVYDEFDAACESARATNRLWSSDRAAAQVHIRVPKPGGTPGLDTTSWTVHRTEPQVNALRGPSWTAPIGLWSWLLQVRALPPERAAGPLVTGTSGPRRRPGRCDDDGRSCHRRARRTPDRPARPHQPSSS